MKDIVFVTSNEGKVKTAQKYLDSINLIYYKYELIEPRSESLEEIAKYKVLQAFEIINQPCIALDSGFYIESLNNWPGTFVNHNLNTLGLRKILKMIEDEENRKASFKECLAYYDGEYLKYFYGLSEGSIAKSITEIDDSKKWSSLWKIFIPKNCTKTMVEMTEEELNNRPDEHTSSFIEFNEFIKKLKK